MKFMVCMIASALAIGLSGCRDGENNSLVDEKFTFYSAQWGESWEDVQKNSDLPEGEVVTDDGNRFVVQIEGAEFLGVKGTAVMLFSQPESSYPKTGFTQVSFTYDDKDEEKLISEGEKIYGERKNYFLDKDGIENPLNLPSWYSEETIERTLSDEEKEEYTEIIKSKKSELVKDNPTYIDAIIRGPLVIISVNEDENRVIIQGDDAAAVRNLKTE